MLKVNVDKVTLDEEKKIKRRKNEKKPRKQECIPVGCVPAAH